MREGLRDARRQVGDMRKPGYLGSFLRPCSFWYVRQRTRAVLVELLLMSGGGYVVWFGHRHWNRFEVVRWIGDQRRGLRLLREPTWLACRMLGDVIVRDIGILEIRLASTRGRIMGWAEGELSRRKR